MVENDAFLQAIIADPEDDATRLIYADFLEEHGDTDRAAFIRTQIQLSRLPKDAPERNDLTQREKELLDRYAWEWAKPLGNHVSAWVFRRGFIEKVQAYLETPADNIRHLLRLAPIRHIRSTGQFCDLSGVVEALPDLARLTGLEFWGLYAVKDRLVREMLTSPHLANLRTLILYHDRNGNLIRDKVLVEGLASPYRSKLRYLAVNIDDMWRGPSERVIRAMIKSPYLRQVRKLTLSDTQMNARLLAGLFRAMPRLERIDLHDCHAPAAMWDMLLERAEKGRLKWLRLSDARLVEAGEERGVELATLTRYRVGFRQAGVRLDWGSEFVDPWNGGCRKGYSWEGLQQQHLFSMWSYVQRKDYDGLEAAFREDCRKYSGDEAADAIAQLPFDRYEQQLRPGLQQAIETAEQLGTKAIYLRIRPDLQWDGEYHLSEETQLESFQPHSSYSYSGPLASYKAPSFPEAAAVRNQHPRRSQLDPGGARHDLVARTVAAFGRCLRQYQSPVPVYFSCMWVVFRMQSGDRADGSLSST